MTQFTRVAISIPPGQIAALERDLADMPRKIPVAIRAALNRTADHARGRIRRALRDEINITFKDTARFVSVKKAVKAGDTATVSITGSRLRLTELGAKQNSKGVTYRIRRGGPRKSIRSAFIQQARKDIREHVWKRKEGAGRYPIQPLLGPSMPQVVLDSPTIQRVIESDLRDELAKNLNAQVLRFLR